MITAKEKKFKNRSALSHLFCALHTSSVLNILTCTLTHELILLLSLTLPDDP